MKEITLTLNEAARLKEQLQKLTYPEGKNKTDAEIEQYVAECLRTFIRYAPARLIHALLAAKSLKGHKGGLCVSGLPLDDVQPKAPATGLRSDMVEKTPVADASLVAIGSLFGEVTGFTDEKEGELVHDLIPIQGSKKQFSNQGHKTFPWHNENAIFDIREAYLLLLGIRPAESGGETWVASAAEACKKLSASENKVLRQARYKIRRPFVYDGIEGVPQYSEPVPLISGAVDDPIVRAALFPGGTLALDQEAAAVLAKFEKMLDLVAQGKILQPGQLFVVDNYRQMHRRSFFKPSFNGYDRHLKRIFVYHSFQNIRHLQGRYTRILSGRF